MAIIKQAEQPVERELVNRFSGGVFWSTLGSMIGQVLRMGAAIVVARQLGKIGYGEYGIIIGTITAFGIFAGLGLGFTATRYVAKWRDDDPKRAGRILTLSILIALLFSSLTSLLLFIFAPILAQTTLQAPHLANGLRISVLILFFTSLNGVLVGGLAGLESFRVIARINIIQGFALVFAMLTGVYFWGMIGVIWGIVFVSFLLLLLNSIALFTECRAKGILFSFHDLKSELPIIWKFGLPTFLGGLLVGSTLWLANTIIIRQPGGYGEFGQFTAANQWRNALMLLPRIIAAVALPMLSAETSSMDDETGFVSKDESKGFDTTVDLTQGVLIAVVIPLAIFIMFFADWVMLLYGKDFSGAAATLIFIILGVAVSAIGSSLGTSALLATGKAWWATIVQLGWALVYICFVTLFAQSLGGISLAIGLAIAELFALITRYAILNYYKVVSPSAVKQIASSIVYLLGATFLALNLEPIERLYIGIPLILITCGLSMLFWFPSMLRKTLIRELHYLMKRMI